MITIQRTVDIPADRNLSLDLPKTVPSGRVNVCLVFDTAEETAASAAAETASAGDDAVSRLLSHKFPTIEEIKEEAALKAAKREAIIKAMGKDPIMELRDSFKHAPFAGVDGVAYQREMRDEAPALYPLDRREAINAIAWNYGKKDDSSRVYAGCLKGKNIFKGDPVAIQRKMRDEWQDARS
ncbi:MAG: hypothetical protein LBD18_05985 [Treponema sp.]|jgi:hypothetical protein|nr:hypothetical protein [Treponema sp.]